MKRQLIQNTKVQPYTSGDAVERNGFLSAVLGAKISADGELTVKVTHSDDGATFEDVKDRLLFPENPTAKDTPGQIVVKDLKADDLVCIDIDLVGLKNYIKVEVSGAGATLALALGDKNVQPV